TSTGRNDTVAIADYDRDGGLDMVIPNGRKPDPFWGRTQVLHNICRANHWVELDLVGTFSNRDAIGARVTLAAGGVTQVREQSGGMHERGGQNSQRMHFGLGA